MAGENIQNIQLESIKKEMKEEIKRILGIELDNVDVRIHKSINDSKTYLELLAYSNSIVRKKNVSINDLIDLIEELERNGMKLIAKCKDVDGNIIVIGNKNFIETANGSVQNDICYRVMINYNDKLCFYANSDSIVSLLLRLLLESKNLEYIEIEGIKKVIELD